MSVRKNSFWSKRKVVLVIVLVAVMALIALGTYVYGQARQNLLEVLRTRDQAQLAEQEINDTVAELSKLTLLPSEQPVVATITNVDLLRRESPFYEGAVNGDKLILYAQAQRAYIYSPSRRILVNAGPLVLENPDDATVIPASSSATPTPQEDR